MIELHVKSTGEKVVPSDLDIYSIRLDGTIYLQKWNGMGYSELERCPDLTMKIGVNNKIEEIAQGCLSDSEVDYNSGVTSLAYNLKEQLFPEGKEKPVDWSIEIAKCKESPYYFMTRYMQVNGQLFTTAMNEEEFNKHFNRFANNHKNSD